MEKPKLKTEESLMEAFAFTEEDLEANREGRFSDRQHQSLINDRDYMKLLLLFWLMFLGGISIFMALLLIFHLSSSPSIWLVAVSAWLISAVCAVYLMRRRKLYDYHLSINRVEQLEGRVRIDFREDHFSLSVEHMTWPLASSAVTAFRNGNLYNFYYSPESGKILSVEPIGEE